MTSLLESLLVQSDPANAALLGLLYYRLDRRLRDLRSELHAVAEGREAAVSPDE